MSWIEGIIENQSLEFLSIVMILLGCTYILIHAIPKIPVLRHLTSVPFLFLVPMLLSNMRIIPTDYPSYKPLQDFVLYIAIFFMVANIDFKSIMKTLQPRIFLLFILACLGTVLGSFLTYLVFNKIIGSESSALVAAATTGIYTGGSMNWVAVSNALDMPHSLNATAFAAAIIIFTLYLTLIVSLQGGSIRRKLDNWLGSNSALQRNPGGTSAKYDAHKTLSYKDFITGFFAFIATYVFSVVISKKAGPYAFIPVVLLITTAALILGNTFKLKKIKGTPALGEAGLFFLLTIIGAQGNLSETLTKAPVLLIFPLSVLIIHVVSVFFSAKILKTDFIATSITTISAVGGAASAPIVAATYNAKEYIPVAVTLGSLGYAVGNYLGIYLGVILMNT
jgi:uncharacterized membrane protein